MPETAELLSFDETKLESADVYSHETPPASALQKLAMTTAVVLPLVGCIIGIIMLWQFGWMGWPFLIMLIFGYMATSMGVTIGFHRLLTHRSFETFRVVKAFWMVMGTLSVQGSPLVWCAIHRRHHGYSDKDGDPHSPNLKGGGLRGMVRGLWHGQVGWLFSGFWSKPDLQRYVPDLVRDKMLVLVNNSYYLFVVASLLLPTFLGFLIQGGFGALLGLIWGGLVRIFVAHHVTWSINSICHVFGQRPFRSGDHSTNNVLCGWLAFGEGWHNNHHAFPSSARHGLRWWQFDLSWWVIRSMQLCGLAWNVKVPTPQVIAAKLR